MRYQSKGRHTPILNKDKPFSPNNASSGNSNPFTFNSKQLNLSKQQNKSKQFDPNNDYGRIENRFEYRSKNQYVKTEMPSNKYTTQTTKNTQGQVHTNKYFNNFFRDRQDKKPLTPTLSGYSHSKGYRKERSPKQNEKSSQFYPKQSTAKQNQFSKDLRQKHPQYQKLHDKLNFLEVRIAEMKSNMQKKRQQKRKFIDNQIRDRQRRQQQRKKRLDQIENSQQGSSSNGQSIPKKEQNNDFLTQASNKNSPKNYNPLNSLVTQVPKHKQLKTFNFNPYSPRHNMYYVSEIVRAYKQDRSLAREHIQSSIHILKVLQQSRMATKQELSSRCMKLQRKKGYQDKKTVVFDLDQTLIHCNQSTNVPYDVKLPIKFPTGEIIEAGINIRPYTTELLKSLSKNFEIIVFTASHSCYANVVLNHIDPQNKYIHHRLFRQHCYGTPEGMYVKDLRVIDRAASDMVLVDNAAYSYAFQIENGIPIIPYYEGKNDFELKALQDYLESHILLAKDVRQVNRKTFKINRYREYDDIQKLVRELYGEWIR